VLERLRWHELDYRADPDRANEWRAACPVCGARRASLRLIKRRRRGAAAMAENGGDTVLPVTATLRCIARQTGAAVLVLHHRPKHRPGYRGSSVLRDQQSTVAADREEVCGTGSRGGLPRTACHRYCQRLGPSDN